MKCRVTILAENNQPVSKLGDNPEEKVKKAWELAFSILMLRFPPDNDDKVTVLEVEVNE